MSDLQGLVETRLISRSGLSFSLPEVAAVSLPKGWGAVPL